MVRGFCRVGNAHWQSLTHFQRCECVASLCLLVVIGEFQERKRCARFWRAVDVKKNLYINLYLHKDAEIYILKYMTYYLGLLNSKGGVGKTSTAMHLAMALSETRSVEVWDSDIQGSATDWAYTAEENNDKLPFAVVSVNYREVQRKQSQAEIVIIDTPPGNSQVLDAVANRSDLLIVPTKPANLDMTRVWATLEAVGNDQPAIVLMTHVNPRTVSYQQAIEALNEAEIAVFDHPIKSLEVIKNNANTNPKNLGGYELVAQELTELIEGMK